MAASTTPGPPSPSRVGLAVANTAAAGDLSGGRLLFQKAEIPGVSETKAPIEAVDAFVSDATPFFGDACLSFSEGGFSGSKVVSRAETQGRFGLVGGCLI